MAVPTSAVPAKNSTLLTVAVPTAVAVAPRTLLAPSVSAAPAAGAVRATLGAVRVTLTAGEVLWTPLESVTRAESVVTPATVGVQVKLAL